MTGSTAKPGILLVAAVALVDTDGRVLLTRRPEAKTMAGLWEFPGGKIEAGETPEAALDREIREELAIDICVPCLSPLSFASHAYDGFHLLMPLYICRKWDGIPRPQEGQETAWARAERLRDYAMPPADEPLIATLEAALA
ncbi:MAG: 8-oxo-dGTP diphosphatase MutT [Alphaproteobacteria bacterium]